MNYILFDGTVRNTLLPFTFTRPVADIRVGILTIREKWEMYLGHTTTTLTEEYLMEKFPMVEMEENVMVNASFLPNEVLVEMISNLENNQAIVYQEEIVAFFTTDTQEEVDFDKYDLIEYEGDVIQIQNTWDIFEKNDIAIREDFDYLTQDRKSEPIPKSVNVIASENIFIEEGAKLEFVTLNASTGPIYIGKNAEIMEGSVIRGPFALCEEAQVKLGSKVYGATTVGPHSRIGGEVNNSVLFGYSNKGHDGFLGNSVLVSTNIFGSGFPRNFVPSFSWGGASGFTTYITKKAFETAKIVMGRRKVEFTEEDAKIMEHIFEETKKFRKE